MPHALKDLLNGNDLNSQKRKREDQRGMSAVDRLLQRKNTTVLSEERMKLRATHDSDEDDDDEVLTVKRRNHELDDDDDEDTSASDSKKDKKKRRTREVVTAVDESELPARMAENAKFVDSLHDAVRAHDDSDRQREQLRVRSLHAAAKERMKGA